MSGHSHYATIKRQKAAKDAVKGKIFSKHAKAIAIAIKAGGGVDVDNNSKLRFAIEQAKSDNMPKANIERVLSRAEEVGNIEEVIYEGYGPEGIAVVIEVATDNRNRTAQEIKKLFERGGGSLTGPGAVSYNFEPKGLIIIRKQADSDTQMLQLIDLGVEDVHESQDAIEVYTSPAKLSEIRKNILEAKMDIVSFEMIRKAKNILNINNPEKAKKAIAFLETIEDHNDVQNVYSNLDIPDEVAAKL